MSSWKELHQLTEAIEAMEFSEAGLTVNAKGLEHFIETNKFSFEIRKKIRGQIRDMEKLAENAKTMANDFREQHSKLQSQKE